MYILFATRDFESTTNIAEITKGLVKERNGDYKIVFFGSVVQDPFSKVPLRLSIIFEFGDQRGSLSCYVQVTEPIQDAGGNRWGFGSDRDPLEWTRNEIVERRQQELTENNDQRLALPPA